MNKIKKKKGLGGGEWSLSRDEQGRVLSSMEREGWIWTIIEARENGEQQGQKKCCIRGEGKVQGGAFPGI